MIIPFNIMSKGEKEKPKVYTVIGIENNIVFYADPANGDIDTMTFQELKAGYKFISLKSLNVNTSIIREW